MNGRAAFTVEPWCIRESELRLDALGPTESVFALSNGHLGVRGNLDEGEPHGLPGTYLNGFYELRPIPTAETQYGEPESGQALINVTNGKLIRLLVDDEPFDLRYGGRGSHERPLASRAGTLARHAEWCSPAHRTVRVPSSFSRSCAAEWCCAWDGDGCIPYVAERYQPGAPVVRNRRAPARLLA